MDSEIRHDENRNDALSQSYIQGVERVAQQNNDDAGFGFNLPKEVLVEREKAWGNLFDKYAVKGSHEIELNIKTMKPVTDEKNDDDNDDDDDDDDDAEEEDEADEEQEKEYYSKCRAPMRKLPALIQYWIDTGNPPYQLIGEEDHSETGSSLSEGEHSRTGHSAVLRESSDNPKFDENSPCSSVDTAAYILSNVNVTKKAQTMAIVEGAKTPDETFSQDAIVPVEKQTNVSPSAVAASIGFKDCRSNDTPIRSTNRKISPNQRSSVMLSEVIPALQQFDELLEKSRALKPPRSALSKVRRKGKPVVVLTRPRDNEILATTGTSQTLQNSEESSENVLGKTLNRRKLYTGRKSPIDLIVTRKSSDSIALTVQSSHPALEPVETSKKRSTTFASRARARRKRKRASQRESEIIKGRDENITPESDKPIRDDGNNNNNNNSSNNNNNDNDNNSKKHDGKEMKEGDERYTDFFESLGLTPSKTLIGKDEVIEETTKREVTKKKVKTIIDNVGNKRGACCIKARQSMESSTKETEDTLSRDIVCSPNNIVESANNRSDKLDEKILSVRIVKLSDDILSRYEKRKIVTDSSTASSQHLSTNKSESVELITTMTHDSDSSTILICSCQRANTALSSESECSLFTKDWKSPTNDASKGKNNNKVSMRKIVGTPKKRDSTNVGRKISKESSPNSSSIETTPKLSDNVGNLINSRNLVVRLEKLPEPAQTNVTNIKLLPRDSKGKFLRIAPLSVEINDLFDSSGQTKTETRCVTIGSRVYGKTSKIDVPETRQKKADRGILGCSMEISLDDEEDNFARIVREIGSQRRTKKEARISQSPNATGKIINDEAKVQKFQRPVTRSRNVLGIVASSDEEEEDGAKLSRQAGTKRRGRIIVTNRAKETTKRSKNERQTIVNELLKDLTNDEDDDNGEAVIRSENRLDESAGVSESGNVSMEKNGTTGPGRSGRKNVFPTWDNVPAVTKDPSSEPTHRKNLFDTWDEAGCTDLSEVVSKSRNEESGTSVIWKFGRGKRRRIFHETNDEKRTRAMDSARFQTRLDSDTDSDSEKRNTTTTDGKPAEYKEPVITALTIDDSKKLIDARGTINESDKNTSVDRMTESNETDERLNGQTSRLLATCDDIAKEDSKEKMKISHRRGGKNGETRSRKVATKKGRRTRIVGTPMEYESDEVDDQKTRENFGENTRQIVNFPNSGNIFKRLGDKIVKNDGDDDDDSLQKKRQDNSKNFFPDMLDDTIVDLDIIFDENSRVTRSSGVMENLNLETPKIRKNLTNPRQSTITFRTRLANDSDDENGS